MPARPASPCSDIADADAATDISRCGEPPACPAGFGFAERDADRVCAPCPVGTYALGLLGASAPALVHMLVATALLDQ